MHRKSIAPRRTVLQALTALLGIWVLSGCLSQLFAESLWFQEVGYLPEFWRQFWTRSTLAAIVTLLSALFLLGNLAIAYRSSELPSVTALPKTQNSKHLPLTLLLPLSLTLSLLLGWLLLHYGQIVAQFWNATPLDVPQLTPDGWRSHAGAKLPSIYLLGVALAGAIALLIYPKLLLRTIAVTLSLGFGVISSANWGRILQGIYGGPFAKRDPLLGVDIGLYVFSLPVWELLKFWLLGLLLVSSLSVALVYLLAENSLSQGRFLGFTPFQVRHLSALGGGGMLAIALSNWISRYELLFSPQRVVYGASFTDVAIELPAYTGLSVLAAAIGLWLLGQARFKSKMPARQLVPGFLRLGLAYLAVATIALVVLPAIVQQLIVLPTELAREKPYIRHHVGLTREAFDLENIDVETFNPTNTLTAADLQKNNLTIRNIRLWDTRPLLQANRQLQQIRPYYKFLDADIDRYTLSIEAPSAQNRLEKQQVLIAARELDYSAVPAAAQTWENEHLVYTHGYGFTLSPVNKVASGGLPDYFVRDIGTGATPEGDLVTSSDRLRASIPTQSPRIYYGEGTSTYVLTNTQVKELDYPRGNENVYNTYDGAGGVAIDSFWKRCLLARSLHDWQIVFTRSFTPQTRLLFRRTIQQRVQAIAPFLQFDHDPYLVAAKVGSSSLFWIVDAYTTSDHYPYSAPGELAGRRVNYVRNSVKAVVDAYNGSVSFYVADAKDPILRTWQAIFPTLFQPIAAMPEALRSHLRYPIDLFQIQSAQLMAYHMTDAQVFYNREDQWQIPKEIYGNQPQPVEPYYLIMKLPTATSEEFVLLLPFTPNQRTNLTAWLASRSDGENYGKSLLYLFPKQQLVFGTEQIEARINQDPVISQQISLWNRQGSRAIQGNLLVIPIAQSLLYVEPLYLEAEQNSIPTLVRVVAAYENRIVMAETLEKALQALFPTAGAIAAPG